ncbi:hypothetical protein HPB47_026077, partial [Ixodes persulcatus]
GWTVLIQQFFRLKEAHCENCGGPHPAYYRSCPLWNQEKDILAVKVKENLSYADAKKRFSFLSKGGYAEVVRRGPAPRSETKATQVSTEILVADLRAPSPQQGQHATPLGKDGPPIAVPALPFKTVTKVSRLPLLVERALQLIPLVKTGQHRLHLSTQAALLWRRKSEDLSLSHWRGSQEPRSCVCGSQGLCQVHCPGHFRGHS